jgi:predicted DNA-binding protein
MPKKRQSQPMQVWLANADLVRLQHAAKKTGRTQSEIAREGILHVLEEFEKEDRERTLLDELFQRFSGASQKVITLAVNEAEANKAALVGSEHLLLALAIEEGRTGKLLCKYGLSHSLVRSKIESGWPSIYTVVTSPPYSPTLVRIIERARLIAKRGLDKYVQPEHLLLSVLDQGTGFAYNILELIGLPRDEVNEAIRKQLTVLRREKLWKRRG